MIIAIVLTSELDNSSKTLRLILSVFIYYPKSQSVIAETTCNVNKIFY